MLGAFEMLDPPEDAAQATYEFLNSVIDGEDSHDLAQTAFELYVRFDGQQRLDLTWLVCDAINAGPLVCGEVLKNAWTDGRHGSPLTASGYTMAKVQRWFMRASQETLMTTDERAVLDGLPDPVTAYRGGPGETARKAASGLAWTLDVDVADFFARRTPRFFKCPSMVVEAAIPREAIYAFLNERSERELVVNYRRARRLEPIAIYDANYREL